ncbi:helix-turn-helix domain-containing protein [Rickettsia endosymbiont of Polydrusus tereticollis]|uniref:helix-turn-helix domain-containing protein n=1 Tax=Rickettsia endosymbiont of Polydrusus tereticollis TaxID=3066251 RepID=UPI003132A52A
MALANIIQIFLKKKLEENNLKRKIFAQESGISYNAVNKLINAERLNPDLTTILKIAKYFNCTIDEVIARTDYYVATQNYKFNDISLEEAILNLRNYINDKLQKNNLNPYKLGREIGFSESPIVEFINNSNKNLSTAVIVALADYFKISIDETIGRVSPSNQEPQQTVEEIKEPSK